MKIRLFHCVHDGVFSYFSRALVGCAVFTFLTLSAVGQSAAEWDAYKRNNNIDAHWTYNEWVAAGSPRNNGGGAPAVPNLGQQMQMQGAQMLGNYIGNEIGKALLGDPAEEARQRAITQQRTIDQQRAAAEAAQEAERVKQETHKRLSGILKLDNFDGDKGGLLLKGVDVKDSGDLARDVDGRLALKLGNDDELKPAGMHVTANNVDGNSPSPNTDPSVVDLRGATTMVVNPELIKNPTTGRMVVVQQADSGGEGEGLKKLQEANATYRQANDDTPKVVYVAMPDKPERPQTLTDQAKELAKEAGDKVKDAAVSQMTDKIPGYKTAEELHGKYEEMKATVGGIAANHEKIFEEQALSAAKDLGTRGNTPDLSAENSRQISKAANYAQDTALDAVPKNVNSTVEKKVEQDVAIKEASIGKETVNIVPVNTPRKDAGDSTWYYSGHANLNDPSNPAK